jgi:hypothetical protein
LLAVYLDGKLVRRVHDGDWDLAWNAARRRFEGKDARGRRFLVGLDVR